VLNFWWLNWGFTLPAAAAGAVLLCRGAAPRAQARLALGLFAPFAVLFALVNLIQFQPWTWDNNKILIWAAVGVAGLAAVPVSWLLFGEAPALLHRVTNHAQPPLRRAGRIGGAALFAVMIASGGLDVWRLLHTRAFIYTIYDDEGAYLAEWARANTAPDSVWLTATNHTHWVWGLTGRQPMMGYQGWLWTHGHDYQGLLDSVRSMFAAPGNRRLSSRYGISYAVVGPNEREEFNADDAAFRANAAVAIRTATTSVYDLRSEPERRNIEPVPLERRAAFQPGLVWRSGFGRFPTGERTGGGTTGLPFEFPAPRGPNGLRLTGALEIPAGGLNTIRWTANARGLFFLNGRLVMDGADKAGGGTAAVALRPGFNAVQIDLFEVRAPVVVNVELVAGAGKKTVPLRVWHDPTVRDVAPR
jgi:hypothetical protein